MCGESPAHSPMMGSSVIGELAVLCTESESEALIDKDKAKEGRR